MTQRGGGGMLVSKFQNFSEIENEIFKILNCRKIQKILSKPDKFREIPKKIHEIRCEK